LEILILTAGIGALKRCNFLQIEWKLELKFALRKLAGSIAGLALKDKEKEKIKLWYKHNSLKPERPLIFCDPENGWNEIIIENMLECKGLLARRWEVALRKELFWGEEILNDKPIEASFKIGYTYTEDDWAGESKLITGGKEGGS